MAARGPVQVYVRVAVGPFVVDITNAVLNSSRSLSKNASFNIKEAYNHAFSWKVSVTLVLDEPVLTVCNRLPTGDGSLLCFNPVDFV